MTFDAVVLASSPHAREVLLGLTLVQRGRRVALKAGARRVHVVETADDAAALPAWDAERGDAGLLVIRAGDRLVHRPLVEPLIAGTGHRRIAVGPDGAYAGALFADGDAAASAIAALAVNPDGDAELVAAWNEAGDVARIAHGDIAVHPATTAAERKGATRMLLRILVKPDEDSPVSKYVYRPMSRPITRLLVGTPISANQVSYAVAAIGVVGCWLISRGDQPSMILGAALVFFGCVIDGCDGELSRLRLTSSRFGAWLDTVVDEATTTLLLVAFGLHTYAHHPEPWLAASIPLGVLGYVASVYGIYYFCIVVLKAGGSQYYIGTLELVDTSEGVALRPKPAAASSLPPWMQRIGVAAMYMVRRDFINLAALALTLVDAYEALYVGMLLGGIVTPIVVIPEHFRLRRQLREVARRGGTPRLVSS